MKSFRHTFSFIAVALVTLSFSYAIQTSALSTWVGAPSPAPSGNIPTPINSGYNTQYKLGGLFLNTGNSGSSDSFDIGLSVFGKAIFNGNVVIATGSPAAGKVLTSLDSNGTVGWGVAAIGTTSGSTGPLVLDAQDSGPDSFANAFAACNQVGKRLPTAEELLYFNISRTASNRDQDLLWSITPDDSRNGFISVQLEGSQGINDYTGLATHTSSSKYRCVSGSTTVVSGGASNAIYDSGWLGPMANSQTRTITHNLGSTGVVTAVYGATNSSGADAQQVYFDAGGNAQWGAQVRILNSNSLTVRTGNNGYRIVDSGDVSTSRSWSGNYIRVVVTSGGGTAVSGTVAPVGTCDANPVRTIAQSGSAVEYQNTTGTQLIVVATGSETSFGGQNALAGYIGATSASTLVSQEIYTSTNRTSITFLVPPGYYYKVVNGATNSPTLNAQVWKVCEGSSGGAGSTSGVSRIIAGTGVTVSPTGGTGDVTVSATGGAVTSPSGSWCGSYNYSRTGGNPRIISSANVMCKTSATACPSGYSEFPYVSSGSGVPANPETGKLTCVQN